MCEGIHIPRPEDETSTQLEGILAQLVLPVTGLACALTGFRVVAAQEMEKVCGFQLDGVVGAPLFINQQGKRDSRLFAELSRVHRVAQANRGESCALFPNRRFVLAQLRDVLAAKDSAVMAEKDQHGRLFVPQGA